MVGVPCQNSDLELPSLFSRPRCRQPDMPLQEAVAATAVAMVVVMAEVITVAAITAVGIVAEVTATISAADIMAAAIFTAERRISAHSPDLALSPRAA